jgi:hypothetical protein
VSIPMETALSDRHILGGILEAHPLLSWRGWWSGWNDCNEPPGTLERVRRETLNEYGLAQFRRARSFLEVAPRIKTLNRRHVTYGWKHCAERWTRASGEDRYVNYYVGEGSFIAACIASGMLIRREKFGTYTNLATAAWSMGDSRI